VEHTQLEINDKVVGLEQFCGCQQRRCLVSNTGNKREAETDAASVGIDIPRYHLERKRSIAERHAVFNQQPRVYRVELTNDARLDNCALNRNVGHGVNGDKHWLERIFGRSDVDLGAGFDDDCRIRPGGFLVIVECKVVRHDTEITGSWNVRIFSRRRECRCASRCTCGALYRGLERCLGGRFQGRCLFRRRGWASNRDKSSNGTSLSGWTTVLFGRAGF